MLTPIDAVLRNPEEPGIRIGGAIPIGLLAPICFQPHLGVDREQVFVVDGEGGSRRLLWRVSSESDHDAGELRFLAVPLAPDAWTGLLDREISVPHVLANAQAGVSVRLGHVPGGSGVVEVSPVSDAMNALGDAGLPDEQIVNATTGKLQDRRSSWLALPSGRTLDRAKAEHASELEEVERWRVARNTAASATTMDGTTVEAVRDAVVWTAADGTTTVSRYGQQLTAQVVVEREALR